MAVKLAVIGLNRLSVSAALALCENSDQIHISAWDADAQARADAEKMQVFETLEKNLPAAIKGAHLVLLSLPADEIRRVLEDLCPLMNGKPALVHLGVLHAPVYDWANEILGTGGRFISMYPAWNAAALAITPAGIHSARADSFSGELIYIADAPHVPTEMLDIALDLAVLLDGQPVLTSPEELDGLIATNLFVPQLMAAALMTITASQPGWREGQHVAGQSLFQTTQPLLDLSEIEAFGQSVLQNGENLALTLEKCQREIQSVRHVLASKDTQGLKTYLQDGLAKREQWLKDRSQSQISTQMATSIPSRESALGRILKLGG